GHLVLEELMAAVRRGVRVRMLVDQLSALRQVETLAALASSHVNFQLRIYNPVLHRARITYPMYAWAAACCWRRLNQRMHSKLLVIDGLVAITGGRNYQDDYYDWNPEATFATATYWWAGRSSPTWPPTSRRSGMRAWRCPWSGSTMSAASSCATARRSCATGPMPTPSGSRPPPAPPTTPTWCASAWPTRPSRW